MSIKKYAFSLIELSVVIIIIGILAAGVTIGSRLIMSYKLSTAQRLTNNSPIGSTLGLVGWYETVVESSFDAAESVDGALLSNWHDSNLQSQTKIDATQTVATNKPFYYLDKSLGIPLVGFATNDYFDLPDGTIPTGNSSYTFFLVSKIAADCACGIIGGGMTITDNSNAVSYVVGGNLNNYWWSDDITTTAAPMNPVSNFHIITVIYNNKVGRKIYINGALAAVSGTPSSLAANVSEVANTIGYTGGAAYYLTNGKLGEVAIFSRALKDAERQDIEKYLGKKFNIKVSAS